jgi:hypothetical protein
MNEHGTVVTAHDLGLAATVAGALHGIGKCLANITIRVAQHGPNGNNTRIIKLQLEIREEHVAMSCLDKAKRGCERRP